MARRAAASAVAVLAAVAAALHPPNGALLSRQRLIVTGCLKECGPSEQSCVTQCQVCVEQHSCPSLGHRLCGSCLEEARAERRLYKDMIGDAKIVGDSGGAPLVHEGIRQDLYGVQLQSLTGHRTLRMARRDVLAAQRLQEWAVAQRLDEIQRLKDKEDQMEKLHESKRRWLHRSTSSVNVTRAEVKALEEDIKARSQQKKQIDKKIEDLQANIAGGSAQATAQAADLVTWTRVSRRLQWHISERSKELKLKKMQLEREEEEAEWFEHGLKKEGVKMARDVKKQAEHVKHMRESEEEYRKQVRDAKTRYQLAFKALKKLNKEERRYKKELQKNPMPRFGPPDFLLPNVSVIVDKF